MATRRRTTTPRRRRRRNGLNVNPEVALVKTQIKDGVSRYLYEQTKRRPMVFPVVVEV